MSEPDRARIGILSIGTVPPNVEAFLFNLARLIGDFVTLDLVTDRPLPNPLCELYQSHIFELRTTNRGLRRIEAIGALLRYGRAFRPRALTHVIDFETYGFSVTVAGKLLRVPSVVRYAGEVLEAYRLQRTAAARLRLFLLANVLGQVPLRFSDRIIALGPRLAEQLRRHGAVAEKIAVIPQPVDHSTFEFAGTKRECREQLGLPADRRIVLFVGRLEWLKGVDLFLNLIPLIVSEQPDTLFCFVGNGPLAPPLRALGDAVIVRAGQAHDLMPAYYRAADLLAHPSRTDGVPTAIVEAMASGLQVIARDVGDVAVLTRHLFGDDAEFPAMIRRRDWEPEPLPATFADDALRTRYLETLLRFG